MIGRRLRGLSDDTADSQLWRFLWLAPAAFYLIWALWFYTYPTSVIERSLGNTYWICKLLVDSGSLLIYRLILLLVRSHLGAIRQYAEEKNRPRCDITHFSSATGYF